MLITQLVMCFVPHCSKFSKVPVKVFKVSTSRPLFDLTDLHKLLLRHFYFRTDIILSPLKSNLCNCTITKMSVECIAATIKTASGRKEDN